MSAEYDEAWHDGVRFTIEWLRKRAAVERGADARLALVDAANRLALGLRSGSLLQADDSPPNLSAS